MSIKLITWAFEQQGLKPTEKLVLIKMADNANDDGECWPKQATMARHTGLARESINRIIKRLQKAGYITVIPQFNEDGSRKNSIYKLEVPGCDAASQGCDVKSQGGVTLRHRGCDATSQLYNEEPSVEPSVYNLPPCIPPTDENHAEQKILDTQKQNVQTGYSSEFEEFWSNFPKKRKGSKERAFTKWKAIIKSKQATADEIINGTLRYAASDEANRENGKYAKGAAAWLNDHRWTIDYEPYNPGAGAKGISKGSGLAAAMCGEMDRPDPDWEPRAASGDDG